MFRRFDRFLNPPPSEKNSQEREHLLELIRESPYARKLKLEDDAGRIEKQKTLLPKLDAISEQQNKQIPAVNAKLVEAEAEERKAMEAFNVARQIRIRIAEEELRLSFSFSHQKETLIGEIKSLAPRCIDRFISELWQLETKTRNSVRTEVRDTAKNIITGGYNHRFESNIKVIEERVAAIREARKQAEALKLEAIPESEILAQLEKLRDELPAANNFEVTIIPVLDSSELRRAS